MIVTKEPLVMSVRITVTPDIDSPGRTMPTMVESEARVGESLFARH